MARRVLGLPGVRHTPGKVTPVSYLCTVTKTHTAMTAINTTSATANIAIIRTTERGALLITDGTRVAWVQGRTHRADGSFTPSAVAALANGKPVAEWEQEQAAREQEYANRKAAREQAFQDGKLPVSVRVDASRVQDYSERAWKVRTAYTQRMYGRVVSVYEYLPKSLVQVAFEDGNAVLTMPKWFATKNTWLEPIKIS